MSDLSQRKPGFLETKEGKKFIGISKHKSGIFYRPDICDLLSIRERQKNYKDVIVKDKIVVDLGANIGGFTYMASKKGAKIIYAFEPEPNNYAMLVYNTKDFTNVQTFNRAISTLNDDYISFYVGSGNGAPSLASTKKTSGRKELKISNHNFNKIIALNPEVMKIDIEGAEYEIADKIPDSCKEITLEWHGQNPTQKEKFNEIYPKFMAGGWKIVSENKREFFVKATLKAGKEPNWVIDAHYRR